MRALSESIFDTDFEPTTDNTMTIETPLDAVKYVAELVAHKRKIVRGEFDKVYKDVKKHSSDCLCTLPWDICNLHSGEFIRNNGGACYESLVLFGDSPRIMILDDPWVTINKFRDTTVLYIENAYPIEVNVKPDRTLSIEVPRQMREMSVSDMLEKYAVFSVDARDQKQLEGFVAQIKRGLKK